MNELSPSRPALRWHGGKWLLAPQIIARFPARAYAEVYNDLDGDVVTLFRILQDPSAGAELIRRLELTPFARAEFEIGWAPTDDPVEVARRLVIRSFMGFGSNAHFDKGRGHKTTGFRADSNKSGSTPAHDWSRYPDALPAIIARLRGVVIERRPAIDVIRRHDGPETLFYVDPPYVAGTRSLGNKHDPKHQYRHEMDSEDHLELLDVLCAVKGMVILSGYASSLYDPKLQHWDRVEIEAFADGARPRTEILWINPACSAELEAERAQLHLFEGAPS